MYEYVWLELNFGFFDEISFAKTNQAVWHKSIFYLIIAQKKCSMHT